MSLIDTLEKDQIMLYSNYIKAVAALSKLYSISEIPFLHYRAAENIFCKSFRAQNFGRLDIAYDAKINSTGIGIKTFAVQDGKVSGQKISEFDKSSKELRSDKVDQVLSNVVKLRNERISFANRAYGISNAIYHYLVRKEGIIRVFETPYYPIDTNTIKNVKKTKTSIFFEDKYSKYSFNFSKSTLYKKFDIADKLAFLSINTPIIDDPYEAVLKLFNEHLFTHEQKFPFIFLPLYSTRNRSNSKIVPPKSGLNQWNAGGRKRNIGETYIPIPQMIHKYYLDFFPARNEIFKIVLPTNDKLKAKICQDGGKALMTNPNKDLAEWLLRKVLKLELGELLTYKYLETIGVDSVKVTKLDQKLFKIDFAKIGSYDEFMKKTKYNFK